MEEEERREAAMPTHVLVRRIGAVVAIALAAIAGAAACGAAEKAAAKDPMKCERDPSCAKERGRYPDCTRQCTDDPECMDRCRQVQQGTDSLGQPQ
jgi:hypothetical protein